MGALTYNRGFNTLSRTLEDDDNTSVAFENLNKKNWPMLNEVEMSEMQWQRKKQTKSQNEAG